MASHLLLAPQTGPVRAAAKLAEFDIVPALAVEDALAALKAQPAFPAAMRAAARHLLETYRGNRLLNAVFNDHGRLVGGVVVLYLHFCPPADGGRPGLSGSRFRALCRTLDLCSAGRATSFLQLMQFAGYLERAPPCGDQRVRLLVPTDRLIALQWSRWAGLFRALAMLRPPGAKSPPDQPDHAFMAGLLAGFARHYMAGFRLLAYAPALRASTQRKAGLLVLCSLVVSAPPDTSWQDGVLVPLSVSALSQRFGVARAHVRMLLAEAEAAGLLQRPGDGSAVILQPRLAREMDDFFAAMFFLLGESGA